MKPEDKKDQSQTTKTGKGSDSSKQTRGTKRGQPRKDSGSKRVNFDNERASKFDKWAGERRKIQVDKAENDNDVTWYAKSPELLKSAASVPFSANTGQIMSNMTSGKAVPGVLALYWEPHLEGDPVQQAMNAKYSFTVHANSRNYAYDAPDQFMMILAGQQIFIAIAHAIRAYGIMRKYEQVNSYQPGALITAAGFDFNDLRKNLSNMWFDINELISRSRQIWIPDDMPNLTRWFWMCTNVYKDADSLKGQFYMYVPNKFFMLSETGDPNGTSLVPAGSTWNPAALNSFTWAEYMEMINAMFNAVIAAQDRGMIFGDLLNAYTAAKIYAIAPISADYQVQFRYSKEVLSQIENATSIATYSTGWTQTDTGLLVQNYAPQSTTGAMLVGIESVLNMHDVAVPSPEQIMVATRLTTLGAKLVKAGDSTTGSTFAPMCAGTEVVVGITSWYFYRPTASSNVVLANNNLSSYMGMNTMLTSNIAFQHEAYDWAPWLYSYATTASWIGTAGSVGSTVYREYAEAIGDWDQFTTLNVQTLSKMHLTALYSELGVPTDL